MQRMRHMFKLCMQPMEDSELSNLEDETQDTGGKYVYFRGKPLRTTGRRRSRYESFDDQIPIDYTRPLADNIQDALINSIGASIEEGNINKQLRLNYLNNLVRLIERNHKQRRSSKDAGPQSGSFKDLLRNDHHNGHAHSMTYEQILICLRCLLTDTEHEIRAAALRVLRYSIQSDEDLRVALRLHMDIFIARCLDVVLDNRVERTQCMRLLISLIRHCPSAFPTSLVQTLLAVCLDGQEENDKLARAATAALCELVVLNPARVLSCGGIGWLIRSILMSGQSTTRLAECLSTVLASVYNHVENQQTYGDVLRNAFYDLLAPLMDEHFKLSAIEKEEKPMLLKAETEQVLDNCRAALVASLRTWPGLIGCFTCSPGHRVHGFLQSPIYALVASLCLDSEKIRDFAIQAVCEIMNVPYQTEHWDSWEKTLEFADCIPIDEYKYSLTQQFANADAATLLGDWNKRWRPNLTCQSTSLILLGLVDAGLINALVRAIVGNPNRALELKMTLVLSDMLDTCGRYLPSIYRQLTLSMNTILQSIYGEGILWDEYIEQVPATTKLRSPAITTATPKEVQRQNAMLLAHRLRILSSLKQRSKRIRTIQMENLISKFCYGSRNGTNAMRTDMESSVAVSEKAVSRVQTLRSAGPAMVSRSASLPADARPIQQKLAADRVHEIIRDSRATVPYSNHTAWDWSLIYLALCQMCDYKHHLDDSTCSKFTSQLVQFFDPAGGHFCKLTEDYRSYSRVGCILMRVLGSASWDSTMGVQLRTFLSHVVSNLVPDRLHMGQLSIKNILNGSCADYFVFIGQLSDTETGRLALEKTGVMQRLVDLVNIETHEAYVKLIASSMLDYDRPGMGRVLLQKSLTSTKDTARLYSTTFLSTLGKLKVSNFADWGMEMLINQLRDGNRSVVEEAAGILEELINDLEYLNALIRLRPSLLSLGDAGVLLLTYVLSDEQAVTAMIKQPSQPRHNSISQQDNGQKATTTVPHNFVGNEIERWKSVFNTRYSQIVDERLCEAFSSFKRLADGSFPRHASRNSSAMGADVYVPPHLYGQLVRHSAGCQLLQNHGCIGPLMDTLQTRMLSTDADVLAMKSALWALGHIASTELGYNLLPSTIVAYFVKIAEECPVLTVRGCAFYALNLIAQSCPTARDRLRQLAWESTSPCPSLAAYYHQHHVCNLVWPMGRAGRSRRPSFEESYETSVIEDTEAAQTNLLSASVTSGGDYISSCSGSSPPRALSPSIFLVASPDASRKSSHAYGHRNRSHYSNSDAHSVLTCASCELCRRPSSAWMMTVSESGQEIRHEGFGDVTSPVKIKCCESILSDQNQDESVKKNIRSKSLGTEDAEPAETTPTLTFSNFLTADPVVQKGQRTPSPQRVSTGGTRKISVPATMGSNRSPISKPTLKPQSLLEEPPSPIPSRLFDTPDDSLFVKIDKRPDTDSGYIRSALGLQKTPLLPEDLPMIQGWKKGMDKRTESTGYLTMENASGFEAWRFLQKQQRERAMSFDAGVPVVDVRAAPGSGATSRVEISEEFATDDDQSQSITDTGFPGDQSPSLQRMKLRPVDGNETSSPDSLGTERMVIDWPQLQQPPASANAAQTPQPNYPARTHIVDRCLHCRPLVSEEALIAALSTDRQEITVTRTPSSEKEPRESQGSTGFRKELLRLVALLSVRKKYAEQGLLRVKQECPQLFRSMCMYCDVVCIMSTYTFRLSARRFLQELFQDVDFGELWSEPRRILFSDRPHHHRLPSAPAPLS